MGEGDNALGCATRKVGRRTLVVRMISGPAVPAAPVVRAIAGLVSRVLAVALEAVNVGWERSLALPKGTTRWSVTPLDCYLTDCRTVPAYDKRLGLPDCRDKISTMIR